MPQLADQFTAAEVIGPRKVRKTVRRLYEDAISERPQTEEGRLLSNFVDIVTTHLGLIPHPNQVYTAAALIHRAVVELPTGEGKTISTALAAAVFATQGRRVHVWTANEYLARRDAHAMAAVFEAGNLSVSAVEEKLDIPARTKAYAADVCYGTASQFGFDHLWDHLTATPEGITQPPFDVLIVDEADAILLDEARVPLIISGKVGDMVDLSAVTAAVGSLKASDVEVDVIKHQVTLSEVAADRIDRRLGVDDFYADPDLAADVHAALKARFLYVKDRDYLVDGDQIVIVDQGTGRPLPNQRWSDGIHEAVEAREKVRSAGSSAVLSRITIPDLTYLYTHVCGLSGTALSDGHELERTYGTPVLGVGPHHANIRIDDHDSLYWTSDVRYGALIADVQTRHQAGQPLLIGAPTVGGAEITSKLLRKAGIKHTVLSARNPDREADVIADAGRPGRVTVATNMAGRGVDIVLGGSDLQRPGWEADRKKVIDAGGLAVIGTARHDARRIDNQLRGRAARQGEPGYSKFYLSIEDEMLSAIGAGSKLAPFASSSPERELTGRMISRIVEQAQDRFEGRDRTARTTANKMAAPIRAQRNALFRVRDELLSVIPAEAVRRVADLAHATDEDLPTSADLLADLRGRYRTEMEWEQAAVTYRAVALGALDRAWMFHLTAASILEDAVWLRSSANEDPLMAFIQTTDASFTSYIDEALPQAVRRMLESAPVTTKRASRRSPRPQKRR